MSQFTSEAKGEPLNVIISGLSDPYILTERGFHDYAKCLLSIFNAFYLYLLFIRSLGYSEECLGLHYGKIHQANLGDGDGRKPEVLLARQNYFPIWGSCWESVAGRCLTPLYLFIVQSCRWPTLPSLETKWYTC